MVVYYSLLLVNGNIILYKYIWLADPTDDIPTCVIKMLHFCNYLDSYK